MPSSFDLLAGGMPVTDFDSSLLDVEIEENVDMPGAFRRVMDDQRGYYLVGFQPSEDTFTDRRFRRVKVKVTRKGLRVRTRAGFYGVATE